MLISKVIDEELTKCDSCDLNDGNDTHDYQTASELFDFMAKNQNFNTSADGDILTPGDLVLLYKNIDIGTKLMTNANEGQRTNQHVETVIHNDEQDSEGSDFSDNIFSNEDIHNVFLINKERLDFFNSQSSVDKTVCHKFGDLEIQSSDNDYDKHFLFKDPYIKEQLRSFNLLTSCNQTEDNVLPTSLLDYVCCKRLEDNYNFYMDNIIIYVKNTIEQLKRISNGDYLTDRAKEKWREVERADETIDDNTKVLATSTSIPLHVECKTGGGMSTWDDIVHSAVDIRSLSKILEKKIVIEIPKLISGSYKLLSKCCADNLIISCKKDQEVVQQPHQSRVDVVFQLKPSETGQLMSNINSIMILQALPLARDTPLCLMAKEDIVNDTDNNSEDHIKIIELDSNGNVDSPTEKISDEPEIDEAGSENSIDFNGDNSLNSYFNNEEKRSEGNDNISFNESDDEIQIAHREAFLGMGPDDLHMTIRKISLQSILPEECSEDIPNSIATRKKSPKARIKSPYENKSHIIEEKKRRKMLAIRAKREQKKMAIAERNKVAKYKYGKVTAMPQPSSSVTKLSITNKSFYNSIYGQCTNADINQLKNRNRNQKPGGSNNEEIEMTLENPKHEQEITSATPTKDLKKIINRSYYLDDTVTEMMFVNMKQDEEDEDKGICTASNSSDYQVNLNLISQLIPSDSEINAINEHRDENDENISKERWNPLCDSETMQEKCPEEFNLSQNVVPLNTPKILTNFMVNDEEDKKTICSIECRKSIDKIYNLMKKLENCQGKVDGSQSNRAEIVADKGSTSIQVSDSGTSLKHHLTSSNPSSFSFEKNNKTNDLKVYSHSGNDTNVIPKVIISSKKEAQKSKSERKRAVFRHSKIQENPIETITQLLRDFENVQKNRVKSGTDHKNVKKSDAAITSADVKTIQRPVSYKRQSKSEQHNESTNRYNKPTITPKEKKTKPFAADIVRNPHPIGHEDRIVDKNCKKKISDILDEAKEARGEAVRGPSKFNSRLSSLAQPKRIYVQAHSEEYQTRYGRNLITDRLQRLAATPAMTDRTVGARNKAKRNDGALSSPVKQPLQSGLQIESQSFRSRYQRSSNCSPERKEKIHTGFGPSYNSVNAPETSDILNKMVAVESYVNSHYKPPSFSTASSDFQYTQKTRTPLLPNDIDIASGTSTSSPKKATEAGNKLHLIINSIVQSNSPGLDASEESFETNSKLSLDNNRSSVSKCNTAGTTDDGIAQARNENCDIVWKEDQERKQVHELDGQLYAEQPCGSVATIEKYNTALSRRLSVGTFFQNMRPKDLSQTTSKQKIYILHSGDAKSASVLLKASISQNSMTDRLQDIMTAPMLPNPFLEWSFTNIPTQTTTVGYAFPDYDSKHCESSSLVKLLKEASIKNDSISQINKSNKCEVLENLNTLQERQCQSDEQLQTLLDEDVQKDVIKVELTQHRHFECAPRDAPLVDIDAIKEIPQDVSENFIENSDVHTSEIGLFTSNNVDNIDYTTSLDVLVTLLNEIKKITTCQTHLANNDDKLSKELETILKKSPLESSVQSSHLGNLSANDISITSLEKLRYIESYQSLSSYYLSDNINMFNKRTPEIRHWCDIRNRTEYKPIYTDKEINVDVIQYEAISRPTDVPSIVFPITVNHGTNVSNSIKGEFHQSPTQSLFSFTEFYSTTSDESFLKLTNNGALTKEIEIPKVSNLKEVNIILNCNKTNLKNKKTLSLKNDTERSEKKPNIENPDVDSVMNIKRDILVTVYSMLVITVFTALSFPEMLMIQWL